jgi:hypothetical protein
MNMAIESHDKKPIAENGLVRMARIISNVDAVVIDAKLGRVTISHLSAPSVSRNPMKA